MKEHHPDWDRISTEHGELFEAIIKLNKCQTIVEIGVAFASCTRYLCRGALNTGGHIWGYDLWAVHGEQGQFPAFSSKVECETNLREGGFSNFTLTTVNTCSEEFRSLINSLPPLDFVFIDGDHSYKGISNDFHVVYPRLSSQGIIAFHDTQSIDGCRHFMLDLRTLFFDGTYDIVDFPYGNYETRTGISLLVKRSYPVLKRLITEVCGDSLTPEQIIQLESDWYKNETKQL